eukprot:scaffold270567_cov35-Tisochrysis_lutea.AAC.1
MQGRKLSRRSTNNPYRHCRERQCEGAMRHNSLGPLYVPRGPGDQKGTHGTDMKGQEADDHNHAKGRLQDVQQRWLRFYG